MRGKKDILLSYYGDDYTGSSDVLEVLSLMDIPTILFLNAPASQQIENFVFKNKAFQHSRKLVFGVAGIARSLAPEEMEKELDPVLKKISQIPSRYFHYKICSTLDSSPNIGNMGVAINISEKYFPSKFLPLLLGFPTLNRFVVFGNLFARIKDTVYRLDRHPVMAKHPITPMEESDIRLHLKKQTEREIELVDVLHLDTLEQLSPEHLLPMKVQGGKAPLLLFDTLENHQLIHIGKWLNRNCQKAHQLLVGSSAVEYALAQIYGEEKDVKMDPVAVNPTLVVSGSCAQTTADQILHVEKLGFHCIRLQVRDLFSPANSQMEIERVRDEALIALREGKNTVVFSALGPDDPMVKSALAQQHAQPQLIATSQAWITSKIVGAFHLKRLVTAGGDTSGYILKALGIHALEFTNVLAPGAPLCTAHSKNPRVDGIEIAIKGGQNGNVRYMEFAQRGGIPK